MVYHVYQWKLNWIDIHQELTASRQAWATAIVDIHKAVLPSRSQPQKRKRTAIVGISLIPAGDPMHADTSLTEMVSKEIGFL